MSCESNYTQSKCIILLYKELFVYMESHFVFINGLWASQRHLVSHCGNRKIDQINLGVNYIFFTQLHDCIFFDFFKKNVTHA